MPSTSVSAALVWTRALGAALALAGEALKRPAMPATSMAASAASRCPDRHRRARGGILAP